MDSRDTLDSVKLDGLEPDRMRSVQLRGLKRRLAVYRTAPEATADHIASMEREIAELEAQG